VLEARPRRARRTSRSASACSATTTARTETVRALQEGAIGDVLLYRCYWNHPACGTRAREAGWSEMTYQMRNWYYFNWLCGDHIVEQHIHNLDVCNWIQGATPVTRAGPGRPRRAHGAGHGRDLRPPRRRVHLRRRHDACSRSAATSPAAGNRSASTRTGPIGTCEVSAARIDERGRLELAPSTRRSRRSLPDRARRALRRDARGSAARRGRGRSAAPR
jgi:hypothetical protein